MSLKHDTSTAAKMVACSELIRRLEHNSIGEVLPETHAALDGEDGKRVATAYIKIDDDGPREYRAFTHDLERNRREEDDVHPQAFAFAIMVGAASTSAALDACRYRLRCLIDINEMD